MRKNYVIFLLLLFYSQLFSQKVFTIRGTEVYNYETGFWEGIYIPRTEPTKFSYLNNSILSHNSSGYMLQAGDEFPTNTNNNLDNALITGNVLKWNGTDESSITHGLFVGYNINCVIKYNYLEETPQGILFKSGNDAGQNMNFTSGGAAYNIVKNSKLSLRVKGINGIRIYNNTFYTEETENTCIIRVDANNDRLNPGPSVGTRIYNNIFYTKYQIPVYIVESWCLNDFKSDYNIFYCETGTPVFRVDNRIITFTEWQLMGFDNHSSVIDPGFIDLISFVPKQRLNYGTNLGSEWQTGLSVNTAWIRDDPVTTPQSGTWQNGAIIYSANPSTPVSLIVFPNPAADNINVLFDSQGLTLDFLRIVNLTGQIVREIKIEGFRKEIQLPVSLKKGLYTVQIGYGNTTIASQKFIVL